MEMVKFCSAFAFCFLPLPLKSEIAKRQNLEW